MSKLTMKILEYLESDEGKMIIEAKCLEVLAINIAEIAKNYCMENIKITIGE